MRLTELVHQELLTHLKEGDLVIDATAGNGYDTRFLAEQVGELGKVIAIDLQVSALESTRSRLIEADLENRVELVCGDHAEVLHKLLEPHSEQAAAIIFNLGYLPGSDKSIQTESTATLRALGASVKLLRPQGKLYVTAYRGHPGGMEEAAQVEAWMLKQKETGNAVECHVPPSKNTPPILWVMCKMV